MSQVTVISGVERRRFWSDEQKRALVMAVSAPGANVAEIARQADLRPGQIYRWRRELRTERPGFAEMVVVGTGPVEQRAAVSAIEIAFAGKVQVRIPASTNPELAAAIVKALAGR